MTVSVLEGDCRDLMARLAVLDTLVDSCVTDPPYHLTSIVKRFSQATPEDVYKNAELRKTFNQGASPYARAARGFMGKQWDGGDIAYQPETWRLVFDLLKPGGHLLAFGSTRGHHRMFCAIEDAGFEIRDTVCWLYGSGFPKSHNLGGEYEGWGTALKPAWEPIVLARKPLIGTVAENVAVHATGALNIDGCRVHADDAQGGEYTVKRLKPGATMNTTGGNWRPEDGPEYRGEMKPGRWPANVVHDGSDEVIAAFPDAPGQQQDIDPAAPSPGNIYGKMNREGEASASRRYTDEGSTNFAALPGQRRGDSGSAARFFYSAKADATDRLGSKHPTVKPVDLIRWLVRLVTPKGGLVLDPFAGTGTTGMACMAEGMRCILIEREAEYVADIKRRIAHVSGGDTPLFANRTDE